MKATPLLGACLGVGLPDYVDGTDTLKRVPCPFCGVVEGLPILVDYERGWRRAWNCGNCGSRWFIEGMRVTPGEFRQKSGRG